MGTCSVCGESIRLTKRSSSTPMHRACRSKHRAAERAKPDGLGARGARVYAALAADDADDATKALAEEAARITDRLDELDRVIAGKGVLRLMQFRVGDIFEDDEERRVTVAVRFDSVLGEARQQANTMRQLLQALGVGKAAAADIQQPKGGDSVDEIAARRAQRGGATSRLGHAAGRAR